MRWIRATGILAAALSALIAGCAADSHPNRHELMAQAEFLVREARWAEAISVLKEYLCAFPGDSGAHFYLGRCWLNVPLYNGRDGPWLVLAEGELRLALHLFHAHGGQSAIERFSDEYFEVICNIERAKVYLKQLAFLADNRGRLADATVQSIVAELREAVEAAKAIAPDSPDVQSFESILATLEGPV